MPTDTKMIVRIFFQRDLYSGRTYSMIWHASIRAARRRVCMISTFSRAWINREKNPARRQLNREKYIFPFPRSRLRIWFRETGSTVQSCASLLILHAQAKSGSYSRDSSRFPRRRPHIPSTAIGCWSQIYRVTQSRTDRFTAENPLAQGQ